MLYFFLGLAAAIIVFVIVYKLFVASVTRGTRKKAQNVANYLNTVQKDLHDVAESTRKK